MAGFHPFEPFAFNGEIDRSRPFPDICLGAHRGKKAPNHSIDAEDHGARVPIYENLVIGNFLFALGLKIGAHQFDYLAPDLAVSLLQQTPLDIVLGDVQLTGPRAVALLEFKRAADKSWKERSKLVKIEALLKRPEFQKLRKTSRQIHFYVETEDILEEGFSQVLPSRVLPYLDLRTDDAGRKLEQLIDDLAFRARSGPLLTETQRKVCQRYLNLICKSQGRSYHASPGLLVGVRGDGGIAFVPVSDIRDLQSTFAAIRAQEIKREQKIIHARIELTRGLRHVQSRSQTLRQSLAR
jgi:hypothetical protein